MKKIIVRILAASLALLIAVTAFASCGEKSAHAIKYTGNVSDVTLAPQSARGGERVEIKTVIIYDADIEVYVDGIKTERSHYDSDYWGYEFVMPNHDVSVEIRPVSGWKQ